MSDNELACKLNAEVHLLQANRANRGCGKKTGYSVHSYESCSVAHESQNTATVDSERTRIIRGLVLTEHAHLSVPLNPTSKLSPLNGGENNSEFSFLQLFRP